MEFVKFREALTKHVDELLVGVSTLYVVEVDKDQLWETYLSSFLPGTNEVFRERREHDCSSCRHFIKAYGNLVIINDNKVISIWDFKVDDLSYQAVVDALSKFVKARSVSDIFISKLALLGTAFNHEQDKSGKILEWSHLCLALPNNFVSRSSESEASISGTLRDIRNVFQRSLQEITEDAVLTILELIAQNSLYKGEEWSPVLKSFLKYKKDYVSLSDAEKELFAWEKSVIAGPVVGKIRGHSIGVLLVNISEGMELNEAVKKYEALVAPSNYKRPKALYTKKMLEDAKSQIEQLGFMDSLGRRFATLDDITVNNVLFSDRSTSRRIAGSVFDEMSSEVAVSPKTFDKVVEIPIASFVKDVLPTARKIEALFENRHASSLVSLIAPKVKDAKTMFKWNNGFSWAYAGNITDSMKERVKAAGGKVDGVLRFSIQWNMDEYDPNDLDAHCIEPNGNEIFFGRKHLHPSSGDLDVDIMHPEKGVPAVENITWSRLGDMQKGRYLFFVHNYSNRGGKEGFTAEIEFDGQLFSFSYNREVRQSEKVMVAEVIYSSANGFSIKTLLPASTSSRKVWGLDTNQFQPVTVCMYSPNYWDEQDGIGHRHYFFMLKDCVNDETPNGFFNEYLQEPLMSQKRVFEALGSKMRVEDVQDQLSGIGFSATKRNDLVVRVEGHVDRVMKIIF